MSFYALSSRRSAAGSGYRLAGTKEGVFWLCLSARVHCALLRRVGADLLVLQCRCACGVQGCCRFECPNSPSVHSERFRLIYSNCIIFSAGLLTLSAPVIIRKCPHHVHIGHKNSTGFNRLDVNFSRYSRVFQIYSHILPCPDMSRYVRILDY